MSDFVINVFRLMNQRGYSVPSLNIGYIEKETGLEWQMTCGGTRAYLVRFGDSLIEDIREHAADSHFMVRRITSSLLLGGAGLFEAESMGRLLFKNVEGTVTWNSYFDKPDPLESDESSAIVDKIHDWCRVLCQHDILRRAADDLHIALTHPHEAFVFIYRGLEWLKTGQNIRWEDIAADLGAPKNHIRELKKMVNYQTGVRHATKTGSKLRADIHNYGTWAAGLADAINAARARLDPGYTRPTSTEVAEVVMKAVPVVPYP